MSTNAYWEPLQSKGKILDKATKFVLRELFGEPLKKVLTMEDVNLLLGAKAGSTTPDVKKDLETLIEAVEKYGQISVEERG